MRRETSRSILNRTRRESRSVVGSVASCRITERMTGDSSGLASALVMA